jgi:hypothetical protein
MKKEVKVEFDPQWLENGAFEICSVGEAQQKGIWTNRFGVLKADRSKLGALVSYAAARGDFAISANGLARTKAALAAGRIKAACVLFLRNSDNGAPEFVAALTIEEVEAVLAPLPAFDGRLGKYWWFPASHDTMPF